MFALKLYESLYDLTNSISVRVRSQISLQSRQKHQIL